MAQLKGETCRHGATGRDDDGQHEGTGAAPGRRGLSTCLPTCTPARWTQASPPPCGRRSTPIPTRRPCSRRSTASSADLDALGDAPAEPMPAHFAAQLDAAIAAEAGRDRRAAGRHASAAVAPVVDLADGPPAAQPHGWRGCAAC